jgi:tetratricopeptide (TPR) repeat protein
MMQSMHTLLRAALALLLVTAATSAGADENENVKAKSFFEKGMAHFQLEEYDAAIENWEAGFRIKPVPEFLYNIGQAYRLSNRPERAVAFYKKYLRMQPQSANRPEVERHIQALGKIIDDQHSAATAPPQGAIAPEHARTGEPAAPPTTGTVTPAAPPAARADLTAPAPPPRERKLTQKAWFWGVVGAGAAVVVAAVVVGLVVGTRSSDAARTLPALRY